VRNPFRTKVVWLGSDDFLEFKARLNTLAGLQLVSVSSEQELTESLSTARAVVFEFDGNAPLYIARLRRTKELAFRHGVLIVLINGKSVDVESFQVVANRVFHGTEPYGPESALFRPIREFQRDLCQAAHEIAIWQPGPATNSSIQIRGNFNTEHENLLRRSFSDFKTIEVSRLSGGASGATVYSVTPREQPRMLFLARIDTTDRIAAEADQYFKYVHATVGFNNRPNVNAARTVYTPGLSILVEDFLERARPIHDVLPNSTPAVLISSVFEGALRNWRRDFKSKTLKFSRDVIHIEKILKRRTPTFFSAAEYANKKMKSPFDGEALLTACDQIEPVYCMCNRIHGDLHAGNIYVGTGSSDAILIDFKTDEGPRVLDPACLEVDIVFKWSKAISRALALKLYQAPLGLPAIMSTIKSKHVWLLDTIRAIRMFGLSDSDRRAYSFAVSCYLIRYASFEDNGTARSRAVAACTASHIIKRLLDEKQN
jgi:hypothetical protein